jgi:hypothetical protein
MQSTTSGHAHRTILGDFNGQCAPGSAIAEWLQRTGMHDAPTPASWAEPSNAQRLDHIVLSPGLSGRKYTQKKKCDEAGRPDPTGIKWRGRG